jgi:hypothetical protein
MPALNPGAAQLELGQHTGADIRGPRELRRGLVSEKAGNRLVRRQRSCIWDKSAAAGMVPRPQPNQEVQLFPNVNATSRCGTVQNVVAINVPRAAEQVNSGNVAKGAHRAVLMAGSWTNP